MERLTRTELEDNGLVICNCKKEECNDSCMFGMCKWNQKALLKLWEYENEYNGCAGCLHEEKSGSQKPCRECKRNTIDYYTLMSAKLEKETKEATYWQKLYEKEHKIVENMREYVKEQIDG